MAGTIQQIAELAGVSRGTVDRALNHRGRVKIEVAEQIFRIAGELGYVPKHQKELKDKEFGKEVYKIGVVTQLSKASFMISVREGIMGAIKYLANFGVQVVLKECEGVDEDAQVCAIKELVDEGIDGLAIMAVEGNKVRYSLNQLIEENQIPVITFNTDIVGTKRCCFVGLDNRKSGETAAGLLGMVLHGQGKVLVITGYFSNRAGSQRVDGFVEELKKSFPKIEVIGVQGCFEQREEVERIVVNAMSSNTELSGIFVVSGGQEGVKRGFEKMNISSRPFVILYDLTPKNERALREGTADFLIDQAGYEQGYKALTMLSDILTKDKWPESEFCFTEINIKTKYNI